MRSRPDPAWTAWRTHVGAALRPWRKLLIAAAAAWIAVSAAGCAMTQEPGGGPLGGVWPLAEKPKPQPKTVPEWMAQERPNP